MQINIVILCDRECLFTVTYHHHNHFTVLFPGPPGWAGARRKLLLDFMTLWRITRGRHTKSPGGHHSIWTNLQSTSINPPIFMLDALPATTLPIYPGLGQAQEYAGLHTPVAWLLSYSYLVSYRK